MNDICIYRHLKPNGKVFYIGIGNIQRPYIKTNRNKFWNNITKKYPNYEIEILKKDLSWSEACILEILLIAYYGRVNNKTGILCNMTDGGEGSKGHIVSEKDKERRRIQSKNRRISEETRLKLKNKIVSKETKQKLSDSRKNMKFSENHKLNLKEAWKKRKLLPNITKNSKKVIDIKTGIIYNSIKDASIVLNIHQKTLQRKLKGIIKNNTNIRFYYEQI